MTRLRRHFLVVTKNKSASDKAQVPAAATVNYYRQGARVAAAITVPSHGVDDTAISVRDVGRIQPVDMLGVNGVTPANLRVTAIMSRTQIMVFNTSSSAISLAAGDRLIPSGNRPTCYKESTGVESQGSAASTDANTGILNPSYLTERFVDAIVTDNGTPAFAPRVLVDQLSGALSFIDVRDYGTIQAAIDACPQGGAVYIPAGSWGLDVHGEGGTLKVRDPQHQSGLTIYGDGWGTELVMSADTSKNGIEIIRSTSPAMGNHTLRDLRFVGASGNGAGRCVRAQGIDRLRLSRVLVDFANGDAISLEDVSNAILIECRVGNAGQGRGVDLVNCGEAVLLNCVVANVRDECLRGFGSRGTVVMGGEFSNGQTTGNKSAEDAFVLFDSCETTSFIKPAIEFSTPRLAKTFLRFVNCNLGNVRSGGFTGSDPLDPDNVGIDLESCNGFVVGPNIWARTSTAIRVRDYCSQVTILSQLVDPDGPGSIVLPSVAVRDLRHIVVLDRKGVLPPVFTTVQPLTAPEGAFWFEGGSASGWWGWDGAGMKQLG